MAKIKIKAKDCNTHPRRSRQRSRGWVVLAREWASLLKALGRLTKETLVFVVSRRWWQYVMVTIVGCGLMGMAINYWWVISGEQIQARKLLVAEQLKETPEIDLPHPTKIYIKWYVNVAIKDGIVQNGVWTLDPANATYLVNSARPGLAGNIIIYGHNTREILGNIRALKGYETIELTLSDGSVKKYKIESMRQVRPEEVKYLEPTIDERLTLFTCDGLADAKRFLVIAKPI